MHIPVATWWIPNFSIFLTLIRAIFMTASGGGSFAPFLGKFYSESLESQEIQLVYDKEGLGIQYYALRLPVKIDSYVPVFKHDIEVIEGKLGGNHPDLIKFLGALYLLDSLTGPEGINKESHNYNHWNATNFPHSINATSTHDTKRGEDVRARINVLSEIP